MTAPAPELVRPQHLWVPERRGTFADEVIDLYRMTGRDVDPEQAADLDALCSYGAGGRLLTYSSGLIEPRQNGKTERRLIPIALADLFVFPPDQMFWTAHLRNTAHKAFEEIWRCIEACGDLSRRVKQIKDSHEEVSIELTNGASLEFLARSVAGGRGLGGKRVFMDEALFVTSAMMAAMFPTLAARSMKGGPQLVYASSAGLLRSDHLRSVRDRGRAGNDPSLIWVEYCAPGSWAEPGCATPDCSHLYGVEGCALDDESLWARANHALDRRISREFLRDQRRTFKDSPVEFGREWLGWWEDPPKGEQGKAIDLERWVALADPGAPAPSGPVVVTVDVPPDRSSTSIGVVWHTGVRLMAMVESLPGTSTAVARVAGLVLEKDSDGAPLRDVRVVALHAGGPAGSLVQPLEHAGVTVESVSTQETAQATGALLDLIAPARDETGMITGERRLGHLNQLELNAAVQAAELRTIGDAKMWARSDLTNLAPLFAVTLGVWEFLKHALDSPEADIF